MGHPLPSQRTVHALFIPACLQLAAMPAVTRPALMLSADFRQSARGPAGRLPGRHAGGARAPLGWAALDQDPFRQGLCGPPEGFPGSLCIRGGAMPPRCKADRDSWGGIGRLWRSMWSRTRGGAQALKSGRAGAGPGLWGSSVRKLSTFLMRRPGCGQRAAPPHSRRGPARAAHGDGGGDTPLPGEHALDRDSFTYEVQAWALRVEARKAGSTMKQLASHILRENKIKAVIKDPGGSAGSKLVLVKATDTQGADGWGAPPDECLAYAKDNSMELIKHPIQLGYTHMNAYDVLRRIIPEHLEVQHSFEMVGHIAHMNLVDELLPYKYVIGAVILDKNPNIRTVVNKVGKIENEFRVFGMEVLAGDEDFETLVKNGGFTYMLDYSKVYWNSRLDTEHTLLVGRFRPGDTVWDVFAGIGPFAIPAAAKGCTVLANDLNPNSYKYLKKNCQLNLDKKGKRSPKCFNLDARQFIRDMIDREESKSASEAAESGCVHAVMNLPASAPEFLDAFRAMRRQNWQGRQLPTVHVYAFSKDEDALGEVLERCGAALGGTVDRGDVECREVRLVAPGKMMVCLSFTVPPHVLD